MMFLYHLCHLPDWLTIDEDGNLSGTVPSDDTKISSAGTVTVKATDQYGGETIKDYVLEFINTNDAPEFTVAEITAYVVETDDAIGVDEARESDNLSGTIAFNDIDAGDDASNLTLSLNDAGSAGSDGTFAVTVIMVRLYLTRPTTRMNIKLTLIKSNLCTIKLL